jgi:hypothetical protein
MPLFEVAIIHEATKKKEEELIIGPTPFVAKDEKSAAMEFLLGFLTEQERQDINPKRAKVLVRPF